MKAAKSGNPRRRSKASRVKSETIRLVKKFGKRSPQVEHFLTGHENMRAVVASIKEKH